MGLFSEIFVWWQGQTMGTRFYTWKNGKPVGTDGQGNRYYEARNGATVGGYPRRWVIYNGYAEASRVPPECMAGCTIRSQRRPPPKATQPNPGSSRIAEPDGHAARLSSEGQHHPWRRAPQGDGRLRALAPTLNFTHLSPIT